MAPRGAVAAVVLVAALAARAGAGDDGLTAEELGRLAKDKVLIAGPEFRQVFQPYINSGVPTFVTSDAVLNAYHVVFEESVVRLERARATKLPGVLRSLWDGIPAATKRLDLAPELLADVTRRAQVTVGTGLRLVGEPTPGAADEVAKLIDAEVARVRAAQERLRAPWLGEPDEGFPFLDYGRFEPRGFYVRDERLRAYFRAVAWLQAVPLRLNKEPELLTALLLAEAMFYYGNSYVDPRDDAPRATSVYAWLGDKRAPGYFHAAIARPRALWVLYPWEDREVLCRGAVLPYREFVHSKRLTDEEWRQILDSGDAPAEPPWLATITSPPAREGGK